MHVVSVPPFYITRIYGRTFCFCTIDASVGRRFDGQIDLFVGLGDILVAEYDKRVLGCIIDGDVGRLHSFGNSVRRQSDLLALRSHRYLHPHAERTQKQGEVETAIWSENFILFLVKLNGVSPVVT